MTAILAGCYNPEGREFSVFDKLDDDFAKIMKEDLHKERELPVNGCQQDTPESRFHILQKTFKKLQNDGRDYEGPHFTKEYRRLQECCSKLERSLDNINVTKNHDLRSRRKTLLINIDRLTKSIANKAHPNGKCCDECEINY